MIVDSCRTALAVGAVAAFSTNIANYGLKYGLEPLYWIAGFVAGSAVLAAAGWWRIRIRPEPIAIWCAAFALISMVWFFSSSQSAVAWQQVQTRLLSVIFLLLMLFLFAGARARRASRQAVVGATLLTAGLNVYELFNPMTFSDIPGRSTGLFANVNQSGAAVVLGLVLGQGVVPRHLRPAYVLATGIGVLPTFSRAAILGWVLVCGLTWLQSGVRLGHLLRLGAVGAIAAVFLLTPWWSDLRLTLEQRGALTENVLDRLAFFERGTAGDASTESRLGVARLAWSTFADHPFAGTGTGATTEGIFELGPHNIYLALLAEHGVVGLVVFPALILAAVWGADRGTAPVAVPFALFIAFWGLFSHNVLEERYILLAFALVGSMVSGARLAPWRDRGARA